MNSTNKIVTAYAKSLFQSVKLNSNNSKEETYSVSQSMHLPEEPFSVTLNSIAEELSLLQGVFLMSAETTKNFKSPLFSDKKKLKVILELFPGLSNILKSFLKVLSDRNHIFLIPEIAIEFEKFLAKFENIVKIKVIIASPLPENYGVNFLKTLKNLTKAENICFQVSYDPKILGGMIIEYNSIAIDASLLKEFGFFFTES